MSEADVRLLRRAWNAFEHGDLDTVADVLDPRVQWYPAGVPDDEEACHTREEAMAFIRSAVEQGLTSQLLDIHDMGERLVVVIHTHAPPEWNRSPDPHGEVVTVRDGKVTEMVVHATVEDALAAASGGPDA